MSRAHASSTVACALFLSAAVLSAAACGTGGAAAGDVAPVPAVAPPVAPAQKNVVTAQMLADAGDVPIEKVLADRIAGVRLDRASDGHLTLRIRGTSSWNSDTDPLYVVDGVPLTAAFGGPLTGINKADIERIQVLKDAASTSMYGSRGASGVVLIETKKP
jgi:TonB-dependent SusC/RagA subfamily outer membrane receptor